MRGTVLTFLTLSALTTATLWPWPLERGDTNGAALVAPRLEAVEDTRPVLEGPRGTAALLAGRAPFPSDRATEVTSRATQPPVTWVSSSRDRDVGIVEDCPVEEVVTELPPDPVEEGKARLVLTLEAEGTGEPIGADLQVWRLAAPGNADWTSGDQLQATVKAEAGSAALHGLPEGTYRVSSDDLREGAEDPAPFAVRGYLTEVSLRLAMPRKFAVWLRVVDGQGAAIARGRGCTVGGSSYQRGPHEPEWVHARALRRGPERCSHMGWCSSSCGCGGGGASADHPCIEAGPLGFHWGNNTERSRSRSESSSHWLEVEGANRVRLHMDNETTRARTYLAVALPIEVLVARVLLPNGRALPPIDAKIEATCEAVLLEENATPESWRSLPIRVKVRLQDHDPLEFEASAEYPSPKWTLRRTLVPAPELR